MRLHDSLPRLAEAEGQLWTHNTGGEHMPKFLGREYFYNPLRDNYLQRLDGAAHQPITGDQWADMLLGDDHEVVVVDRVDTPNPDAAAGLVAVAIAERARTSPTDKVINVKEMLVHPELRGNGLSGYLLRRLVSLEKYNSGEATELVVDTTELVIDPGYQAKLVETGFKHTTQNGCLGMWLPGNRVYTRDDLNDAAAIDEFVSHMPAGWHGHFTVMPEDDPQTWVYRDAKLTGILRCIPDTMDYDDNDQLIFDFCLSDPRGAELAKHQGITEDEAIIDLLNNHGLV